MFLYFSHRQMDQLLCSCKHKIVYKDDVLEKKDTLEFSLPATSGKGLTFLACCLLKIFAQRLMIFMNFF